MFKAVLIVPIFNHLKQFKVFAPKIKAAALPVILCDDASVVEEAQEIQKICAQNGWTYLKHTRNQGKGKAVQTCLLEAVRQNYTHALQIDADGQHNIEDVSAFLRLAKENPKALICGFPKYDNTIPKARLYGRKITHFWTNIETWGGTKNQDFMCGFRVYPLKQIRPILKKIKFFRMGFDIEILVKAYWQNIPLISLPTKVIYPKAGTSHFRAVKDNVLIFWLHTCLFCSMLYAMPRKVIKNARQTRN